MSRMLDQIYAAQELEAIYTEWKINPAYPGLISNDEFDKVMLLIGKFVGEE